ncbi:MAG: alkene reductase, partial [Brachymonas sp.]
NALGLAYIHLAEADWDDAPQVPLEFRHALRKVFSGAIMVAGGYDQARASAIIHAGLADLVAFGRPFIANPDFPNRVRSGKAQAAFDPNTLFGGTAKGYTDYPALH